MSFERLIVEHDPEEGWVAFRRAGGLAGERYEATFHVPKGFFAADVLEAARGTGWVVDREGAMWIEDHTGCKALADAVVQMLDYFDAPGRPSKRLSEIQAFVGECLAAEGAVAACPSPWVCAWLDVVIHDDVAECVLTARDVWQTDVLHVDLRKHRARRVREVLERIAPASDSAKMAPSQRWRRPGGQHEKEAG